jgi:hypothetical protein
MDKTIRVYASFTEMKADEYHDWQSSPVRPATYLMDGAPYGPEVIALLSIFNACEVRYLIVGGYAASRYGPTRDTKDMDLLIPRDAGNAERLYTALAKYGAPLDGLNLADFKDRGKFFRIGRDFAAVEILPEINGVDFEKSWEKRMEMGVDSATGLRVWFLPIADLIDAKVASGRPHDLADLAAVQEIQWRLGPPD